jgi:two-component system, NtrC family, sensor histidine kinase GlrK
MRWARPKSLTGLMTLGLAIIAVPLLVAILNAAFQIRALAEQSQRLVDEGVQAARASQDIFAQIASLERTTRVYQVLGSPNLLDDYRRYDARLTATRAQLEQQLRTDEARRTLARIATLQGAISRTVLSAPEDPDEFAAIEHRFTALSDLADRVARESNAQVDADLAALQRQTERARQRLFWQSALLLPLTLVAILALTLVIGRPLRQIDRSISELGRGNFSRTVDVSGPLDLERLGHQLEWLRLRLLDLAQERNRFLRHMSHELKTPLANIREGTDLLMDGAVGELDTGQREVTAILRENGIKLQRLIENLLSFSAWQTSSVGLELSEFRLRPLIKQVLENQQLTLLSQRVRLDVRVEDVTLVADRGKLRLILENLLSNAIKYSPKGGAIHMSARAVDEQIILDVADSGPGIPHEDRGHIFEAFYTGKAPRGGSIKGTGIGLSVVLEFVAAHGGAVQIIDGEYPGAHFRITMPLHAGTPAERAHAA